MTTEKEIGKGLLEIRDLINLFDDGHHLKEVQALTTLSNELLLSLSEKNQIEFKKYLYRKELEKES